MEKSPRNPKLKPNYIIIDDINSDEKINPINIKKWHETIIQINGVDILKNESISFTTDDVKKFKQVTPQYGEQ